MRTVDPEIWSKKLQKPKIQVIRGNKFGQQPSNKVERIFRESFVDAARDFWRNCSVPAIRHVNMEDISKQERRCYIASLLVTVGLGMGVVSYTCYSFYVTPPLVISGLASEVGISDVPFPAVALCSNGVITRQPVENFSDFLLNHPVNRKRRVPYSREQIDRFLANLGSLLMMTAPRMQIHFTELLREIFPHYNITNIMSKMAPPCASVLRRCSWRGRLVPCDSMFASRVTPLGFCCVFNSRYYPEDADNAPQVLDMVGHDYGLGVVIVENRDDFKYFRRNAYGAEMLLFEGSEYPLLEGGDVRMFPVPRNVSVYVNVRVTTQQAEQDIEFYSEEWRECRTHGRGMTWCLTKCRRDTAVALCGCVPYVLVAGEHNSTRPTCGVRDLPCLNKHREKFMYLYPTGRDFDPELSQEREDGLVCEECRVSCRRRLYSATLSYARYEHKTKIFKSILTRGLDFVNSSIVRVFYTTGQHNRYSVEAYLRWYEVIVKISTQWTVVAGVSVMTGAELLYHGTFRWVHHFIRRYKLASLQCPTPSM